MAPLTIEVVKTSPIDGQKAGTSGLRKPTKLFTSEHYLENFIQATLSALGDGLAGCQLVLGGDGRYFCDVAANRILELCAGNGVAKVMVGQHGILSTPSVSCVIRKYGMSGGIVLTASHNPGGPDNDFGVKFNVANGGPAPEAFTDRIYANTVGISEYRLARGAVVDLSRLGRTEFNVGGKPFVVEVIDSVADYEELMSSIFDFDRLRAFVTSGGCSVLANPLHGVMGPYVKRLLCQRLGVPDSQAVNCVPLPDFGGGHPDPNLTYAAELVAAMRAGPYDLGVAFDGDGDRNMILGGRGFFVTPCDSLAVLAANLQAVPYFRRTGVAGFARSMPTSGAVDRVAAGLGLKCYEVPTGWKFFGNLLDAGMISLCGEESFGTGSDHIREKDGLWAALAWLSVLAERPGASVEDIVTAHWRQFGRNFYTRYDYENVTSDAASQVMSCLQQRLPTLPGTSLSSGSRSYAVASADNFSYRDPVDASVTANQGVRVVFADGSRIVYRLSGTGSSGATIRVYIEQYEAAGGDVLADPADTLRPLVEVALSLSKMAELTGRSAPTVIT